MKTKCLKVQVRATNLPEWTADDVGDPSSSGSADFIATTLPEQWSKR